GWGGGGGRAGAAARAGTSRAAGARGGPGLEPKTLWTAGGEVPTSWGTPPPPAASGPSSSMMRSPAASRAARVVSSCSFGLPTVDTVSRHRYDTAYRYNVTKSLIEVMTMSENKDLILVIGGTGKTGRRVLERLEARGLPVRIGTPSTDPPFDWLDPSTWAPAVQGVKAAYVTYSTPGGGDIAFPGAADRVRAFAKVAVDNGVGHLVLLSGRNEAGAEAGERAIQESGADWTIVRSSFFAQDFSEYLWLEDVMNGEVAFPAGDTAEPFIDLEDLADVATAALTDDPHQH